MTPLMQTEFGTGGNCLAACIASVLEVSLDSVPNYISEPDWEERYDDLLSGWGYRLQSLTWDEITSQRLRGCWLIGGGKSPRGIEHAVLIMDGEIVHDPHPEGGGLVEIEYVTAFVAIDPARLRIDR